MAFPEERDRKLQERAIQTLDFAEDLTDWVGKFNSLRIEHELCPVPPNQEFDTLRLRRLAGNLFRSSRVPVATAVYGASQVGKSLFVGRVLKAADEGHSPLGRDERLGAPAYLPDLSFDFDLNPRSGTNEATAIVTRFTTKDRFELTALQSYPVLVKALSRSEWLRVLARGFDSECEMPNEVVWNTASIEHLLEDLSKSHGATTINREWRLDLLDCFTYMKQIKHWRFPTEEMTFNAILSRYPLSDEGYTTFAGTLFWNKWPEISELFTTVCRFIDRLKRDGGESGMLIHWMAVRFLLDSQRTPIQESENSKCFNFVRWSEFVLKQDSGWWVLDYQPGRQGSEEDLATIQSGLLEMVIPVIPELLSDAWRRVLERIDFLDIPGLVASGKGTEAGGLKCADTVEKLMNIVKRGKVFFLFDRYIEELQIQTLLLLISGRKLEVRETLKGYVDRWGKGHYGEEKWPRGVDDTQPAFFVGMTGLDEEFRDERAKSALYENRLRSIVELTFREIMTDFGGHGKPFTNVYPIRYPGTWDYDEARRIKDSKPEQKWVEAGEAFLSSERVQRHVASAELKWRHAMQDHDGGVLLIAGAFEKAASAERKQFELDRRITETRQLLCDLGLSWKVNPDTNIDRERRIATAEQVVRWLHSDPSAIYWRIEALESSLCLDSDEDFAALADLGEFREAVVGKRPEPLEVRFPNELRTFLQDWGTIWAPHRWKKQVASHPHGGPWLEPEQFSALSRYLAEYLQSPAVFTELCDRLMPIIRLQLVDAGVKKHARRKFVRMVLCDFMMNPGPGMEPLTDVILSDAAVEVTARSKMTRELLPADYGLMTTVLDRWRRRLASALASGAGADVKIPPGNDELVQILERYGVM
ncbi:MAG: hypothetical protein JSS49_23810 [Planctomycetes bacterium]|nr:hypothetical protein [Planctomycetota bacterium]